MLIYADFESILEKTDDIKKYQKHIPCGFCDDIKSSLVSEYDKMELDDCIKLTEIMSRTNKPLDLSPNEEKSFEEARICHRCSEALVKTDERVGDHRHIMGKYRGAAHNNCNLNYRTPTFKPVLYFFIIIVIMICISLSKN